jgi:hypothetical protein
MARSMALSALLIASSRVMPSPDISVPRPTSSDSVQCPVQRSIRSRDTALRLPSWVGALLTVQRDEKIEHSPAPSRGKGLRPGGPCRAT